MTTPRRTPDTDAAVPPAGRSDLPAPRAKQGALPADDGLHDTPDLLYSDEEDTLRSAVRRLLADHCDPVSVIRRTESDAPHDRELWRLLAEDMGLAGLLVPERLGGQGATHRETAVVLEELGRAVAPVPFLTSAVMATEALLGCLPREQQDGDDSSPAAELLASLTTGRTVAVLAVPLSARPLPAGPVAPLPGPGGAGERSALRPAFRYQHGTLHGRITGVADAVAADVLLVPADSGLYAVDVRQDGVTLTAQTSLDGTRPLAAVNCTGARARLLTARTDEALYRALSAGAGLLASEQLGVADWCLAETVRYTRDRHQFNRPVGSFQALKHRLAQVWLSTVHARAAARYAAGALATGSPETPLAVALAQSGVSDVAVHAAEEALQLHGGIGMTWEHPVHLYLKRAKADSIALGTAAAHRGELAQLAALPAPATPSPGDG